MDAPAHLPRDEAEFADWSVYADYLIERGDRRGEVIAHELALPADPSDDELAAFRARANRTIQIRTKGRAITWSLGHVRALELLADRDGIGAGALGGMAEQIRRPEYARLEELRFAFVADANPVQWRLLLRRLPPTCTRLAIDFQRAFDPGAFAAFVARVPATIRELVVGYVPPEVSTVPVLQAVVDDRFAHVELSHRCKVERCHGELLARLADTARVHVRTNFLPANERVPPRLELGEPGDAIVDQATHRSALRRWTPAELQSGQDVVPIRMLLARTLPEGHLFVRPFLAPHHGSQFVRLPTGWLYRRTPVGPLAPIAPGATELLDGKPFTFAIRA